MVDRAREAKEQTGAADVATEEEECAHGVVAEERHADVRCEVDNQHAEGEDGAADASLH